MRPKSPTLTPQELRIMTVVWERGTATVRDVYEALRAQRRVAYTTVMTMMNVLERKGHLKKQTQGRSYVYEPTRSRNQTVRALVRDFLNRVFGGSAEPLLVHLIEDRRLSRQELEELTRRIRQGSPTRRGER
jgi:predicted transcriptional regulator